VSLIKVTAGIIRDKDKVLITRRAPKENHAGGWEFPGGKVEENETPEECLARELKEELHLDVSIGEFCTQVTHDYGHININLLAYYCIIVEAEIQVSVHDKYQWVKINDLLKYDLLPADIPIARKVKEDYYE